MQCVQLDHTRDGLRRWGGNGVRWEGEGDVGEVHRLHAAAFVFLLSGRFTPLGVHLERSSFAFLGSLPLGVAWTNHGKEGGGAERAVCVSAV